MELIGKTDEEIIQEEYKKVASLKIKNRLERILGTAYNFLPVGVMPSYTYDAIKKKHKYFRPLLSNVTSLAYEAVIGTYLVFQNTFSYVQNFTFNGMYGSYNAPLFSISIPEQAFVVAGLCLLSDLPRLFAHAQKTPMGNWVAETGGLIKNWYKMRVVRRNSEYVREAMQNVKERLEANNVINRELYVDNQRNALGNLQERMYYCNKTGLNAEANWLKTQINELRRRLGMNQL
jgi:hypothetical protein